MAGSWWQKYIGLESWATEEYLSIVAAIIEEKLSGAAEQFKELVLKDFIFSMHGEWGDAIVGGASEEDIIEEIIYRMGIRKQPSE